MQMRQVDWLMRSFLSAKTKRTKYITTPKYLIPALCLGVRPSFGIWLMFPCWHNRLQFVCFLKHLIDFRFVVPLRLDLRCTALMLPHFVNDFFLCIYRGTLWHRRAATHAVSIECDVLTLRYMRAKHLSAGEEHRALKFPTKVF